MAFERPDLNKIIVKLRDIGITILEGFEDIYQKAYEEDQSVVEDLGRLRITVKKKAKVRLRTRPKVVLHPVVKDELTEEDESIREVIDVQSNDFAKTVFVDLLRSKLNMPQKDWFSIRQLIEISNQYNLPFIAIPQGGHWYLMLRPPTIRIPGGQFGAWVYDPMRNGEIFLPLNWLPDARKDWQQYLGHSLAASKTGIELAMKGQYNLSLKGESHPLQDIKGARKQFDEWNCGPICLFQAMLLAAVVNSDQSEFEIFRDNLGSFENEFGIDILTREEILS